MHPSFTVSIHSALTRSLTPLTRSLALLHRSSLARSLTRSRDRGKMWDNVPISACYPDAVSTQGYAKLGLGLLSLRLLVCSPTRSFARSLAHSLSPLSLESDCLLTQFQADSPCHSQQPLISIGPIACPLGRSLANSLVCWHHSCVHSHYSVSRSSAHSLASEIIGKVHFSKYKFQAVLNHGATPTGRFQLRVPN